MRYTRDDDDELVAELIKRAEAWGPTPKKKEPTIVKEDLTILTLRHEINQLKMELKHLKENEAIYKRSISRLETKLEVERANRKFFTPVNTVSTPIWLTKYIKFLVFACHPDRNSGRSEAVEVTKELLKLYRR